MCRISQPPGDASGAGTRLQLPPGVPGACASPLEEFRSPLQVLASRTGTHLHDAYDHVTAGERDCRVDILYVSVVSFIYQGEVN